MRTGQMKQNSDRFKHIHDHLTETIIRVVKRKIEWVTTHEKWIQLTNLR